jgi:hypothetical protein
MSRWARFLSLVGLVALAVPVSVSAQKEGDKGEMVANPYYKFWSDSKPGSVALHHEVTRVGDAKPGSDGVEEKRISYKVLEVNPKQAVIEVVVTEDEYFGTVQSAPTRHVYPAQVGKAHLERFLNETGAKAGEESLKIGGKEIKCKTVTATIKAGGGEETEYKMWLSPEVTGSIVKQVRTTRSQGKMIAETTTTLQSSVRAK